MFIPEHLKGKLEDYIKQFNGKVKLYRNVERLGLIGTRTRGAKLSTGDVIVFLDAHCECNKNWLVPLLARIRYDRYDKLTSIVNNNNDFGFNHGNMLFSFILHLLYLSSQVFVICCYILSLTEI